jgi:hypothetical protein
MSGRPPISRGSADDYQTPPEALEPMRPHLRTSWTIWECASGNGNLVDSLRRAGYSVIASDKRDGQDFLKWQPPDWDCLVSNPPFSQKNQFLARAYALGKPFALLLPLTSLESQFRQRLFERHGIQLLVLPDRVRFERPDLATSRPWFPVAWFTWGLDLPAQLTFVGREANISTRRQCMTVKSDVPHVNGDGNGRPHDQQIGPESATNPIDAELVLLEALNRMDLVARDRITQVAHKEALGFYFCGPPGTGKTHLVLETLKELGVLYHYHKGHLTAQGIFELMKEHSDKIIVLDDVGAIFADKKAVQYLLAALGRQQGQPLETSYVRQGRQDHVTFTGGLICVSNLQIENEGLLAAFRSRVHVLRHAPSDPMLVARARRVCRHGWPAQTPKLVATEVDEVIDWVWAESRRLNASLDLRVLFEKSLPDYLAWREHKTAAHWKDLVTTTLEGQVRALLYTPPGGLTKVGVRQATKEEEWEIVRDILKDYTKRKDRIWAWQQRTGKCEKTFDRRWAEVKARDRCKGVAEAPAEEPTFGLESATGDTSDTSDTDAENVGGDSSA